VSPTETVAAIWRSLFELWKVGGQSDIMVGLSNVIVLKGSNFIKTRENVCFIL
jgi:hypothetical protein